MQRRAAIALALAASAAAFAIVGVFRGVDASSVPAGTAHRLSYGFDTTLPDADREAALRRAVDVIRERIDERGAAPIAVTVDRDVVDVVVPDLDPADVGMFNDIITRTAKLDLELVVQGAGLMQAVHRAALDDPAARGRGVIPDLDPWVGPDGTNYVDFYLRAADRAVLDEYFDERWIADPTSRPTGTRHIAYERVEPAGEPAYWRSYLLEGISHLDPRTITGAEMTYDPTTGDPLVMVTLDQVGALAFAELTGANTGRKLAIVLDGIIKSAPVIQDRIAGGRIQISMGTGALAQREQVAHDLLAVLKTGALPAPLKLAREQQLTRTGGSFLTGAWPYFLISGVLAAILAAYLLATRGRGDA